MDARFEQLVRNGYAGQLPNPVHGPTGHLRSPSGPEAVAMRNERVIRLRQLGAWLAGELATARTTRGVMPSYTLFAQYPHRGPMATFRSPIQEPIASGWRLQPLEPALQVVHGGNPADSSLLRAGSINDMMLAEDGRLIKFREDLAVPNGLMPGYAVIDVGRRNQVQRPDGPPLPEAEHLHIHTASNEDINRRAVHLEHSMAALALRTGVR